MKKPIALLLALFMLFAVAACTNTDDPAPKDDGEGEGDGQQQTELSSVDKIKQNGKLKLGTSADYPPFEYHMMVDGQDTIVGFDIELAQLIADELGVELDITDMGFDALLISLQQGKFDLVAAGVTYKPERYGLFSDPYYVEGQAVLVRTEDLETYTTADSLSGCTVGAQKGTVQAELAANMAENVNCLELVKFPDLVTELKQGHCGGLCRRGGLSVRQQRPGHLRH